LIGLIALIDTGSKKLCQGFVGGVQHCTPVGGASTGSSILAVALFALLVLAPIATSIYLARRAA
jgi:hypothetical protein